MSITQKELKKIKQYRCSDDIPHWYDKVFFADLPRQGRKHRVLVRKTRRTYSFAHMWANYTDNKLFSQPHRVTLSWDERLGAEVDLVWHGSQPLLEVDSGYVVDRCTLTPVRTIIYHQKGKNLENGLDAIKKAYKSQAKSILEKTVRAMAEIHQNKGYHGDALMKNVWIGEDAEDYFVAQWIGFMQNVDGMELADKQALDYLNLILSHRKYCAEDTEESWWDLMRWSIAEIKGTVSQDMNQRILGLMENIDTKGVFAARRLQEKELGMLVHYFKHSGPFL